jgi:hypothetical protein
MVARFSIYCCAVLLATLSTIATVDLALADSPPPINGGGVSGLDLKTQLEKGLKARRPVEFQYIDQIIQLVEDGSLPVSLVQTTYGWARKQTSARQLQYFQFALQARVRSQGLNVKLPNLNNQAVGISNNGGQHGFQGP